MRRYTNIHTPARTQEFPAGEWVRAEDVEQLLNLLRDCSEKLAMYRKEHSGVYVGGVEYTELQRRIEEALK